MQEQPKQTPKHRSIRPRKHCSCCSTRLDLEQRVRQLESRPRPPSPDDGGDGDSWLFPTADGLF